MKVTKLRTLNALKIFKENITDELTRKATEDAYENLYEVMIDSLESYCNTNLTEIDKVVDSEEDYKLEFKLAAEFLRMYADRLEEASK